MFFVNGQILHPSIEISNQATVFNFHKFKFSRFLHSPKNLEKSMRREESLYWELCGPIFKISNTYVSGEKNLKKH